MELTQQYGERPSALPAMAAFRMRPLSAGFDRAAVRAEGAVDPRLALVSPAGGSGRGSAVGVASTAARRLADLQLAGQGCSVPTATAIPAARQRKASQQKQQFQSKHVTTTKINVVPAYGASGVGGAPPRGRPD